MPGALNHSPADILRYLIIGLGQGTLPTAAGSWPVHYGSEPPAPDSCITVYATQGMDYGRTAPDQERQGAQGFQVRVRTTTQKAAAAKAWAIAIALDGVLDDIVNFDSSEYLVKNIKRTSDVLDLGYDTPSAKRSVCVVNGLVVLRLLD